MASPDRFDGLEVDQHLARFQGTVELDPTDADNMSMDTQFMAVVVCTVNGASIGDNRKGEVVRTNRFKLDNFAVVRDGALRDDLYETLPALLGAPDVDGQLAIPLANEDGERIVVEVSPEVFETGLASTGGDDDGETLGAHGVDDLDEDYDDDEVYSPGARQPVAVAAERAPAPGSQPRSYDAALSSFLRE